jgi:hypothetical protein
MLVLQLVLTLMLML